MGRAERVVLTRTTIAGVTGMTVRLFARAMNEDSTRWALIVEAEAGMVALTL